MKATKLLLLVDDDADVRDIAQISLELETGWDVLTAPTGREGLAIASTRAPDLILLDFMMPGWDGPTTLERLRTNPSTRNIPVIFLTAKVHPADQDKLRSLPVRGVVTKPFDPVELPWLVSELAGWG